MWNPLAKKKDVKTGDGTIKIYLNGPIPGPDNNDIVEAIEAMRDAEMSKHVYLYINTTGGSLDTTKQIIHAIKDSDATVVGIADGEVASGGSLIFFSCDGMVFNPYASFLLHDAHGGAIGKVSDNIASIKHTSDDLRRLYTDIYGPFFSEEEIEEVLNGREFYLSSEEAEERVKQYAEK